MAEQHPNLRLIESFFQAYAINDLETIKEVLSPSIEWYIPGKHPLSGKKSGVDEVLNYLRQLSTSFFQARPIVMGINDDYVVDCHLNWSNRPEGENLEAMSCLLWSFQNGKISKVYNFPQDQHNADTFFNNVYGKLDKPALI
jgi:ketosteroid isomerase-like protein